MWTHEALRMHFNETTVSWISAVPDDYRLELVDSLPMRCEYLHGKDFSELIESALGLTPRTRHSYGNLFIRRVKWRTFRKWSRKTYWIMQWKDKRHLISFDSSPRWLSIQVYSHRHTNVSHGQIKMWNPLNYVTDNVHTAPFGEFIVMTCR